MDVISNLGLGFAVALTLQNAAYCFIGVLLGTVIGVLPGIGPVTTVAMLLPISFTLQPEAALIMLAGIYYGAQYGGSTTAILVNIPGEASSVVTTIDGHQMARQGRAGPALGIAALGSFFAGCASTLLIALAAPPLAAVALQFGPAEYFSLMVCGLVAAVVLARGSLVKASAMVVLGLLLGLVGTDVNTGARRFNFGMMGLADGIEFVAISMAIYGVAEVVYNLEKKQEPSVVSRALGRVWPSLSDLKRCAGSILRGTALGAILGVLPGGGALLASFAAYTLEKKVATPPRQFGYGDIRGVAAPESANNAGAQTSFIPMLTLGILGNPRLRGAQARLRAGAAHSRLRAGADDGGEPAPRASDLARRSDGFPAGADQPGISCGGRRALDRNRRAGGPAQARGGAQRIAAIAAGTSR